MSKIKLSKDKSFERCVICGRTDDHAHPEDVKTIDQILDKHKIGIAYVKSGNDIKEIKNHVRIDVKKDLEALIADRERLAVYNMHKDIIGTGNLELGQETDTAFNYARIHRWIDAYIERLTGVTELSTEGDK